MLAENKIFKKIQLIVKLSRYAEVSTEGHRGGGNLERLALILLL